MLTKLFLLLCGHALADFALQPELMAQGKNRNKKPTNIPEGQKYVPCWHYWLSAHALISGGVVYMVTGQLHWGVFEVVAHWVIDFIKCDNITNPNQDQAMHFACRLLYLI